MSTICNRVDGIPLAIELVASHIRYLEPATILDRLQNRLTSQAFWMGKLHLEHDNMIAALNWSEHNDTEQFASLAGAITWFWTRTNNYSLAKQVIEKIITNNFGRRESKARILSGYGWIFTTSPDQFSNAIKYMKQSSAMWHRLKNKPEEALVLADLSFFYYGSGDDQNGLKTGRKAYEIALEEFQMQFWQELIQKHIVGVQEKLGD